MMTKVKKLDIATRLRRHLQPYITEVPVDRPISYVKASHAAHYGDLIQKQVELYIDATGKNQDTVKYRSFMLIMSEADAREIIKELEADEQRKSD